ncbi:MAG: Asp-tRNA(Asn)/Glu-tRNA(Gln) amidotransferase subunit GatC [Candidatus Omnitrophica bacterium]|nr:Asp-tRNA(Asn)/Glu-tRNA(Gln) amidotransferase subunit GatC [Candidatus Omnitrophota bacterium]MDD5573951.1 Asp-tRNA(Asn)/Glu-tRNA(Gln) amidotransferase subunit GatC [Candidatus Omnitrophota bacterium]
MSISRDDVTYIANLARLGLTEEEITHFQGQLEGILAYVDKLKEADVHDVEPMTHALDLKNVYRKDVPVPSLDPRSVLKMAPAVQDQFYKVPKVIE